MPQKSAVLISFVAEDWNHATLGIVYEVAKNALYGDHVHPSVRPKLLSPKLFVGFYKNLVPSMCTWRHWATVTFVKLVQRKTCFSAGRKYKVGGTFHIFPPLFLKFSTQNSHKLLFNNRKFCWNRSRRFLYFYYVRTWNYIHRHAVPHFERE